MRQKWSLIKEGEIVETITNGDGKFSMVGGRKSGNHTDEWLLDNGYLPHIQATPSDLEKLGGVVVLSDRVTNEILPLSNEELLVFYANKRGEITGRIYGIADSQTEQLRSGYSVTEAVRWTEDRSAVAAGDWAHFTNRAGSTMTGQQYAESRIIPKITAGDIFLDKVISKRTDLIVALANTLDEDLLSFDYTTMWDDLADYVPPPIEIVTSTAWAMLMASIKFNVKLW